MASEGSNEDQKRHKFEALLQAVGSNDDSVKRVTFTIYIMGELPGRGRNDEPKAAKATANNMRLLSAMQHGNTTALTEIEILLLRGNMGQGFTHDHNRSIMIQYDALWTLLQERTNMTTVKLEAKMQGVYSWQRWTVEQIRVLSQITGACLQAVISNSSSNPRLELFHLVPECFSEVATLLFRSPPSLRQLYICNWNELPVVRDGTAPVPVTADLQDVRDELVAAFGANTSLTHLDIYDRYNWDTVWCPCLAAVANAAAAPLEHLGIDLVMRWGNRPTPEVTAAICEAVGAIACALTATTLDHVHVGGFYLDAVAANSLVTAWQQSHLKKLTLSSCVFDEEATLVFQEFLPQPGDERPAEDRRQLKLCGGTRFENIESTVSVLIRLLQQTTYSTQIDVRPLMGQNAFNNDRLEVESADLVMKAISDSTSLRHVQLGYLSRLSWMQVLVRTLPCWKHVETVEWHLSDGVAFLKPDLMRAAKRNGSLTEVICAGSRPFTASDKEKLSWYGRRNAELPRILKAATLTASITAAAAGGDSPISGAHDESSVPLELLLVPNLFSIAKSMEYGRDAIYRTIQALGDLIGDTSGVEKALIERQVATSLAT